MSTRLLSSVTRKRAHGCELAASPGSHFVWVIHLAGLPNPVKVRLLKVIDDGGEDRDWPFLIGVKYGGRGRLGRYRWAHIYPSRRAAMRAMNCANAEASQSTGDSGNNDSEQPGGLVAPPGSVAPAGMHTDYLNPDGTVDDTVVETYYAPCTGGKMEDGYIRIFADNGGTDIETRVSFAALVVLGWTPPQPQSTERSHPDEAL